MKLIKEIRGMKPKPLFMVFILHLAILIVFLILGGAFSFFVLPNKNLFNPVLAILTVLAYFLLLVLAYSFFKVWIIEAVNDKKVTKKSFDKIGGFFLFNITAIILGLVAFALVGSFISYSFSSSLIAIGIFAAIFLIFYYPFLALSQFAFVKENKIFRSMKQGWRILFSNITNYLKILLFDVIIFAVYILVFFLLGSLYKIIFITNNQNTDIPIAVYNWIFVLVGAIVALVILSINIFLLRKLKE